MSDLDISVQKAGGWGHSLASTLSRNWFLIFAVCYGLFVGLPFLAPIFMQVDWTGPGKAVYLIYSFFCHQLPERSIFLFGPRAMYNLETVQSAWQKTLDPMVLRQFVGNPQMGWKVAWSDRMVSMYSSVLLFGLLWWPLRRRVKPLPWWMFLILLLPMALDGTTHLISDLWGIEQGFRQNNVWLAELTHHVFPAAFYAGNALGSFNSWMRWITGILFGLGIVWFLFPMLEEAIAGKPGEP